MSNFSSDFQTLIKHYFPLYFLYELLMIRETTIKLLDSVIFTFLLEMFLRLA